jgi:hypothetical protein
MVSQEKARYSAFDGQTLQLQKVLQHVQLRGIIWVIESIVGPNKSLPLFSTICNFTKLSIWTARTGLVQFAKGISNDWLDTRLIF